MKHKKKLIEVALPLDAINKASAREKSIRHGHPSTLHLWWARRPLAAARAVIFAQMVDDPSVYVEELLSDPEKKRSAEWELRKRLAENESQQDIGDEADIKRLSLTIEEVAADLERKRLFSILRDLVLWENTNNEIVLQKGRDEIWKSWRRACTDNTDHPYAKVLFDPNNLPAFHDPFAGGGTLPLEAQRLGLAPHASDINPVAVLINKAMIEIPSRFGGCPPVNPEWQEEIKEKKILSSWDRAKGLAEDIRYYGDWMREETVKRVGHLYPEVEITAEMAEEHLDLKSYVGQKLTVIAWLWVRTVKSPNPAFADLDVPLASTFMLSTRQGKEAYVEPVITEGGGYRFTIKTGVPPDVDAAKIGTKLSGANFKCLISGTPITDDYIKAEGIAGRIGARLMAIVLEGHRGRVYLAPTQEHESVASQAKPEWMPSNELIGKCRDQLPLYGMNTFADVFTSRQLVALTTFSDLVTEAMTLVKRDAIAAGFPDDGKSLRDGGNGAVAYAEAVGVYLAFVVDKCSDYWSNLCTWITSRETMRSTFGRQAIPMVWDYTEANPFSSSSGNWMAMVDWTRKAVQSLPVTVRGSVVSEEAQRQYSSKDKLVSTDPPYYDNIEYADLSDFFYVWLRRSLKSIFPDLFSTLAVPKLEELVAASRRHGSKEKAEKFFLKGMTQAIKRIAEQAHPHFPVTIYYAFKQSESKDHFGVRRTGWETFLEAVIQSGFAISGTWPIRTERAGKLLGFNANILASSIVLVCRKHFSGKPTVARSEFIVALKSEIPKALRYLQEGNIAPVDLTQAAIGPGMAVYTSYSKVLDAKGDIVSVRDALTLINQILDEVLVEREGDFDSDTRWALTWFEQHGFSEGPYGIAETLSKAKNTSVDGLVDAGILFSRGGKVRLLKPDELSKDWDPETDLRLTVWEMVHHLVCALEVGGELSASDLIASLGGANAESARELSYRLYAICEREKYLTEARSYNGLVQSWPEITRLAMEKKTPESVQASLFDDR